ncbi:hypothetical protein, partial [Macellibacteroides fermentans]|uniref:hypothetical protein n=1 Tax=Macellibacteroides fermentans TaxID=879969 RepID=UPI00352FB8BF
ASYKVPHMGTDEVYKQIKSIKNGRFCGFCADSRYQQAEKNKEKKHILFETPRKSKEFNMNNLKSFKLNSF